MLEHSHRGPRFTWDRAKAANNIRKHEVSFDEAQTVFVDPLAVIFNDEAHSDDEKREIIVGHSCHERLLLVCFIESDGAVRIISARQATSRERRDYEKGTMQ